MNANNKLRIGITIGDAAGIGPELIIKAINSRELSELCTMYVYGQKDILDLVATKIKESPIPAERIIESSSFDVSLIQPGSVHSICGSIAAKAIEAATYDALNGKLDAVVTAPINKAAIHEAGINFPGHTEMLASLTKSDNVRMFFWSPNLSVCLATIHEAIRDVEDLLTIDSIYQSIKITAEAMAPSTNNTPKIGVLGFNPHAGENGLFGTTEKDVIVPAIEKAKAEGINVYGPIVPDVAFRSDKIEDTDAFIAMYHDQGLIPFKMLAFDTGVNVTLGLPFIRTSPDHGTAFDIAWKGIASTESLFSAIKCACMMTSQKK